MRGCYACTSLEMLIFRERISPRKAAYADYCAERYAERLQLDGAEEREISETAFRLVTHIHMHV